MAVTNTILATAMGGTSVLVFNKLLVDHQYSFLTVKSLSLHIFCLTVITFVVLVYEREPDGDSGGVCGL